MKTTAIIISFIIAGIIVFLTLFFSEHDTKPAYRAKYKSLLPEVREQIDCLAENIYFESKGEPKLGQVAVGFVTLNRAKSDLFPKNICNVVKQQTNKVCQFSWYCEDKHRAMLIRKDLTTYSNPVYNEILETAVHIYLHYDKLDDPTNGALFFHAVYVQPGWKNLKKTVVIGKHIFYKI